MITVLLALAAASADPVVAHAPQPGLGGAATLRQLSVGGLVSPHGGFAVDVPWSGASVTISAVGRIGLTEDRRGWFVDVVGTAGLIVPTVAPGAGIEVAPAVVGGLRTDRFAGGLGLSAPLAVTWTDRGQTLTVPAITAWHLGGRIGPVWLTATLRAGVQWTRDLDTAVVFDPGLSLIWTGAARPRARR